MKKIVATALSLLLGVFGYTIADKELSARVDELEVSVSRMQEEINSLKNATETTTTTEGWWLDVTTEQTITSTSSNTSGSSADIPNEWVLMPRLIGMTSDEAIELLTSLGFENIHFAQISETVDGICVASQYPSAGYSYPTNISITLYLQ